MQTGSDNAVGVYGLRLVGHPVESERWLNLVATTLPMLEFVREPPLDLERQSRNVVLTPHSIATPAGGGQIEICRDPLRCILRGMDFDPISFVHPLMGFVAAAASLWLGRAAFHAGAFVTCDRAWLIAGDSGTGKSSSMAALAELGFAVLADDISVVDGTRVFPGPRSIDLRREAAERFRAEYVGFIGRRDRWRLRTDPPPAVADLGGFVFLEWGHKVGTRLLQPTELLIRLGAASSLPVAPLSREGYLELIGLPAVVLTRPNTLSSLDDSLAALLESVNRLSSGRQE